MDAVDRIDRTDRTDHTDRSHRDVRAGIAGLALVAAGLIGTGSPDAAVAAPEPAAETCSVDPMSSPFEIERVRDTGGRVFWSPDGRQLAFMEDGEAHIRDMETGEEYCLTCAFESAGFERVQFLGDGSLLLIGAADEAESALDASADLLGRVGGTELWWMPADASAAPQSLDQRVFEGVAMSPTSNRIAWTESVIQQQDADPLAAEYELRTGRVEVGPDGAAIVDRELVHTTFSIIEAQDILDGGATLLFSSYYSPDRRSAPLDNPDGEVMTVDVATGDVTNHTNDEAYDEAEGVFHGTDIDVIESGRDTGEGFGGQLDLYALRLDGTGDDVRRLTHVAQDTTDEKANNPDVHPDGRRIAFSVARVTDDTGEATGTDAGIFLLTFGCEQAPAGSGAAATGAPDSGGDQPSPDLAATGGGTTFFGLSLVGAAALARRRWR